MKTIDEIRLINGRQLRDKEGGNSAFARKINREPTQTSRFLGPKPTKSIGDDLARHIEKAFNLERGWLDVSHSNGDTTTTTKELIDLRHTLRWVPILEWSQIMTFIQTPSAETLKLNNQFPCPVPCGEKTFVLDVNADSMLPEYRPGELVFVDPDAKYTAGDDVIAFFPLSGQYTFRRLVHDSGSVYLKALNETWPEPYINAEKNCVIVGKVIFSGKIRH